MSTCTTIIKQTHFGVFVEERRQRSAQISAALQHNVSADSITLVEVVVLGHGAVQRPGQLTAGQFQLLA